MSDLNQISNYYDSMINEIRVFVDNQLEVYAAEGRDEYDDIRKEIANIRDEMIEALEKTKQKNFSNLETELNNNPTIADATINQASKNFWRNSAIFLSKSKDPTREYRMNLIIFDFNLTESQISLIKYIFLSFLKLLVKNFSLT